MLKICLQKNFSSQKQIKQTVDKTGINVKKKDGRSDH